MCTSKNIQIAIGLLSIVKVFQIIFLFAFGIILEMDQQLQRAFHLDNISNEDSIKGIGTVLLLASIFGFLNLLIGLKGTELHNKFLLMIYFTIEFILFCIQLGTGMTLNTKIRSKFSLDLRLDCMRVRPFFTSVVECNKYVSDPRTRRFFELWKDYFMKAIQSKGLDSDVDKKRILNVQIPNLCCGFYPPLRCQLVHDETKEVNTSKESYNNESLIDECRPVQDYYWYPDSVEESCPSFSHNINEEILADVDENDFNIKNKTSNSSDEIVIEKNGCPYSLPLGECKKRAIYSYSLGCGAFFEEKIIGNYGLPINILLISCCLQVAIFFTSCCYFWKRKREHVLPNLENFRK